MHIRPLLIATFGTLFLFLFAFGCTKFDTTKLGSDLIPVVDNINTFADTVVINSSQGYFDDSTVVYPSENHALGKINNDPLFGKTEANIFFQLKPNVYPYRFGNAGDTLIAADSVILTLSYRGSWGDTLLPQQLEVREIVDDNFRDSVNKARDVKYKPALGALLGAITVVPKDLNSTVYFAHGKDSAKNQIRIKLSNSFRDYLFSRDTSASNFITNAFRNDSLYRRSFNGLGVTAVGSTGNAIMYINISEAATRLEMHFRKKNSGTGVIDTVYNALYLSPGNNFNIAPSATANNIIRDRTGTPSNTPSVNEHYLQTSPGTFVNLSIPGLSGMPNRIIHRAQITIEQVPDNPVTDAIFTVPPFMYLDLKDTGSTNPQKFKAVYFDLNPSILYDPDFKNGFPYFPRGGVVDFNYFGGVPKTKPGPSGQVTYYDFNITRYIQQLVTKQTTNYAMRLWPAYSIVYPQYSNTVIPYNNPIAYGRVKIGSGSNPNFKMRLVIIYSNIQ